jgi:RNA polymerase sigma-70 factor (ECF subfamily)
MMTVSQEITAGAPIGLAPAVEQTVARPLMGADALAALIARIADRADRDAFRALFLALGPAVKGLAMRQGADRATAEEILQETFLTVWRKAPSFAPERGAATTWIFAIARNLRIDLLRKEAPWQELTDDYALEPSPEPQPDETLATRQIQSRVQIVLSSLPAEQASVIRLAYIDGLSHSEISERLGTPLGTVKTRMSLAYQKIKAALQEYE